MAAAGLALAAPAGAEEATGEGTGVRTLVQVAQPVSAAEAAELDLSIQADSHGCGGNEASNNSYVHVCFVRNGDKIFVKDDEGNGRSAIGQLNFYDAGSWYNGCCLNPDTAAYRGYDSKGDSVDHFTDWRSESTS